MPLGILRLGKVLDIGTADEGLISDRLAFVLMTRAIRADDTGAWPADRSIECLDVMVASRRTGPEARYADDMAVVAWTFEIQVGRLIVRLLFDSKIQQSLILPIDSAVRSDCLDRRALHFFGEGFVTRWKTKNESKE